MRGDCSDIPVILSGVAPPRTLFPNSWKFSQSAWSFWFDEFGLHFQIPFRSTLAQGTRFHFRFSPNRLFVQW